MKFKNYVLIKNYKTMTGQLSIKIEIVKDSNKWVLEFTFYSIVNDFMFSFKVINLEFIQAEDWYKLIGHNYKLKVCRGNGTGYIENNGKHFIFELSPLNNDDSNAVTKFRVPSRIVTGRLKDIIDNAVKQNILM